MKQVEGFFFPDDDIYCGRAVFSELHKLDLLEKYLQGHKVCVQAGGNVGVFPKALGSRFETVYTFEPDPENFNCLVRNCPEHNIIKLQAAVGEHHDMVKVGTPHVKEANNCGAYQVLGSGDIPTLLIDDLPLTSCDLIYLDIEGFEKQAIVGARDTIEKFNPVIVLEQKILPIMFEDNPEAATEWLVERGYEFAERTMRDNILVPR